MPFGILINILFGFIASEENGKKSHHEKESHEGEYDEKRSHEKGHHDEGGYFEKKAEGKKGQKGHKFYEEGSFKKGHSIKGKHVVHSLDESKKDKEFFEEDNDEAYDEKHGDFHEDHASKKGGSHKKGHHEKHYAHAIGGKKGIGKKGNLHDEESGSTEEYLYSTVRLKKVECDVLKAFRLTELFLSFTLLQVTKERRNTNRTLETKAKRAKKDATTITINMATEAPIIDGITRKQQCLTYT